MTLHFWGLSLSMKLRGLSWILSLRRSFCPLPFSSRDEASESREEVYYANEWSTETSAEFRFPGKI